mmetsp:Transcript_68251/g.154404  ORF Transcript_68251/g.154404 Transcript_68251/m.154404 type:complete len:245 (+) Transcript_68251:79-813(+)
MKFPRYLFAIAFAARLGAIHGLTSPGQSPPPFRSLEAPRVMDVPVYSLATLGPDGETNMNILTYASPVGIRPKRTWVLSLYRATQTHANFLARGTGVLQVLREDHAQLIWHLGGTSSSSAEVDKRARCAELGFPWRPGPASGSSHDGPSEDVLPSDEVLPSEEVLPGCAAYYRVRLLGELIDAGDHQVAYVALEDFFEEESACGPSDGTNTANGGADFMSSAFLREQGLVSAVGKAIDPFDTSP